MKIRSKLLLGFLPIALAAVLVPSALLFSSAQDALRKESLQNLDTLSTVESSRIEAIVAQQRERLALVASRTRLRKSLNQYLQNRDAESKTVMRRIIADARDSIEDFEVITVATMEGEIVVSTAPNRVGALRALESELEIVRRGAVSLVPYKNENGKLMIRLMGPFVLAGKLIGIVTIDASAATFSNPTYAGLGKTGENLLVFPGPDGTAMFITAPRNRPKAVLEYVVAKPNQKSSRPPANRLFEETERFQDSGLDYRGVEVFSVAQHLQSVDWGLVTKIDQSEALRPISRLKGTLILVVIIATLLTLLLVILTVVPLTLRLASLTRFAEVLLSGKFDQRSDDDADDEIGQLSTTLNAMAGTIEEKTLQTQQHNDNLQIKNAELERFTYSVSHDLKSPLVTIKGFADFIKQDLEKGDIARAQKDIVRIGGAAAKMGDLLENVLELSRIGRVANPPTPLDWNRLFDEALALVQGEIDEAGAQIEVAAALGPVWADSVRLVEVLQNLLSNAIKFRSADREMVVHVSADKDETGRPIIVIADNGIGIPVRHQKRVFGLFERLDHDVAGTGVGLALVRRIVEYHGGSVWFRENDGHGTEVCLYMPTKSPA